ncbi:flagellar brake protein [Photobacterium sagamiensis]|uniref:flagellar brake domain-containing protein n=1 Tax=Photobacterium sagamiensis TaxID=2910241 RepID=UPI003D0D9BCB
MKTARPKQDIDTLKLMHIGMRLLVEVNLPNGKKSQATSRLIGYKKDDFILIEYPTSRDTEFENIFLENAEIIVRAITETSFRDIVAFKAKVNTIVYRPVKMLSLDMPVNIANHKIRQQPRVETEYVVSIESGGNKIPAKMMDFSISGCRLITETQATPISQGDNVTITLSLTPHLKGQLEGLAVSIQSGPRQCQIGIQFDDHQLELKKDIFHNCIIEMRNHGKLMVG